MYGLSNIAKTAYWGMALHSSNDPWEILAGSSSAIKFFGVSSWFSSSYDLFRTICICICVCSILFNICMSIYSNIFGDTKAMAEHKSSVINKITIIAVISGLLSILTSIKGIIDGLYGM